MLFGNQHDGFFCLAICSELANMFFNICCHDYGSSWEYLLILCTEATPRFFLLKVIRI